jgi:hypothetical protein
MTKDVLFAIVCIIIAVLWQYLFYILPSKRRAYIAINELCLSECLLELNQDALPKVTITKGSYIHDYFYKFLVSALYKKIYLKFPSLSDIKGNKESDIRMNLFDNELNDLCPATKAAVTGAIYAVSRIMFLNHPFEFIVLFLMATRARLGIRSGMISSGKYITVASFGLTGATM